ncbi:hypothetical protein NQZ68_015707 [Dissostichus eleginoides]|nr:hypothetical protein NQZ68_015707 [Dissostichus eleginoides]
MNRSGSTSGPSAQAFCSWWGVEESERPTHPPTLSVQGQPQECKPLSGSCKVLTRSPPNPPIRVFFNMKHFQTMLKTKLNVLTLRKEPLPTVIFHEPEAIELCSTTPLTKGRTHAGYKQKTNRASD